MRRFLLALMLVAACGCLLPAVSQAEAKKGESPHEAAKKMTEITLERGGGDGGPEDSLTLRRDGTALYVGKANVERIGRYKGTITEHCFHDNFPLLAEAYAALRGQPVSTGKPTGGRVTPITIRVVWDGKKEEIRDHCPGLDQRLWSLEMAARGIAADIKWKKDEPKRP
jgi:hypothetical protein